MFSSKMTLFVVTVLISVTTALNDCQNRRIMFVAEPKDLKVECGVDKAAVFPCQYVGHKQVKLQWIINATVYPGSQLPPDHHYDNTTHKLFVTNLQPFHNSTTYQCQLVSHFKPVCAYKSAVGQLLIVTYKDEKFRAISSQSQVLGLKAVPHYSLDHQNVEALTEISTTFTQQYKAGSLLTSYIITFADATSRKICDSAKIPPSSCIDSTCSHNFNIPSSSCLSNTDIVVTVMAKYSKALESITLDGVNTFFKVYLDNYLFSRSITLKFLNQTSESEKFYLVRYGSANLGCKHLPKQVKGQFSHSNSITVELNVSLEETHICLDVIATNGSQTVSMKGVYYVGSDVTVMSTATFLIVLFLLLALILISSYCYQRKCRCSNTTTKGVYHDELSSVIRFINKAELNPVELIDLSTTFFKLVHVTEDCLFYKFGEKHFPNFKPRHGYGYRKVTTQDVKKIKSYKRVIVMGKNDFAEPKYTVLGSAFKEKKYDSQCDLCYVQEKDSHKNLKKGDQVLYCVRSKDITITSFWKMCTVTRKCTESDLMKENISGYTSDWLRYGYFEFIKPEFITTYQRIIVQKKSGELVTGPGVRHLIGVRGDSSKTIDPPDLKEHPDWERVFVQSSGNNRKLTPHKKYLFCALMEKIKRETHRLVLTVQTPCKMEEFGRRYIPGFKTEMGYGYFEFTREEFLKPYKSVVVMDEDGNLFTGPGAKFLYTGYNYGRDEIEKKKKISPPNLTGTRWKHIFIQSHKEKDLLPCTKFLYCEYSTEGFN